MFFSFISDAVKEFVYKPFFAETFRLIKYYSLTRTAKSLLISESLYSRDKGVRLLQSIAYSYPEFRQDIITSLCESYKDIYNKYNVFESKKVDLQKTFIRAITSIKKEDENSFPFLFDIEKTAMYSMNSKKPMNYEEAEILPLADFRRTNFKGFYMPGSFFMNINFNGSSFVNADVGGAVFYNCSLEFCNFKDAKICGSLFNESIFVDQPENHTCFIKTRLYGANLGEADFSSCKIRFHKEEDRNLILNNLTAKMPQLKVIHNNDLYCCRMV